MVINGRKCTSADIEECWGISDITSRAPTDPAYESERLQESHFYHITRTKDVAEERESRVFRLQNGEWNFWKTDGDSVAVEKVADLTLGGEIDASSANMRAVQLPWVDGNEVNKYLGFDFHNTGEEPWWTMQHRIVWGDGSETVQGTWYSKMTEAQQEGWTKWLAEGVKKGFVGMKGYLGG